MEMDSRSLDVRRHPGALLLHRPATAPCCPRVSGEAVLMASVSVRNIIFCIMGVLACSPTPSCCGNSASRQLLTLSCLWEQALLLSFATRRRKEHGRANSRDGSQHGRAPASATQPARGRLAGRRGGAGSLRRPGGGRPRSEAPDPPVRDRLVPQPTIRSLHHHSIKFRLNMTTWGFVSSFRLSVFLWAFRLYEHKVPIPTFTSRHV